MTQSTARINRNAHALSAADQQARLSHQLAIVTNRIEVLLEERKEDLELCRDLQQMLKEMCYMGNIARTLLQALRRERWGRSFRTLGPV